MACSYISPYLPSPKFNASPHHQTRLLNAGEGFDIRLKFRFRDIGYPQRRLALMLGKTAASAACVRVSLGTVPSRGSMSVRTPGAGSICCSSPPLRRIARALDARRHLQHLVVIGLLGVTRQGFHLVRPILTLVDTQALGYRNLCLLIGGWRTRRIRSIGNSYTKLPLQRLCRSVDIIGHSEGAFSEARLDHCFVCRQFVSDHPRMQVGAMVA
jgi:hypothetical protein